MSRRRVVVVERRWSAVAPWQVWAIYDSVGVMRADCARLDQHVPVIRSGDLWKMHPWTWTDQYGADYRAQQRWLTRKADLR